MKPEDKINEEELNKDTVENETEEACNLEEPETDACEKTIEEKYQEAQEKVAEIQDKYLRQVAEFDNFRKRTIKEKTELILNGSERAVSSILPILDDMERALQNMTKTEDVVAVKEGMELIYQKFLKILSEQGVRKIEVENADFDTDLHEAIAQIPAPSDDLKGKVLDCVQAGYKLNDKVIRHSKVAVGL